MDEHRNIVRNKARLFAQRNNQEEWNQFERNKVWNLVHRANDHSIIGTK